MRIRVSCVIIIALFLSISVGRAQSQCIKSSQHYEGHPKPNVYVVTVINGCEERRILTVKISDAITLQTAREEEFPLDPGDSRAVRVEYQGERMFFYEVKNRPPD
jgi:hypothetical protein